MIATFSLRSPPSLFSAPNGRATFTAGRLRDEAEREEDHVAFVALHALEVLHEEPLGPGFGPDLNASNSGLVRRASRRAASTRASGWVAPTR